MNGKQTAGSSNLEVTVNRRVLEVNSIQSKLKDMNQYANEFAVILYNRSQEKRFRFFNPERITAREYRKIEEMRMPYDIGCLRMKVPASVEIRQGDFATAAECEKFKFRLDGWTVSGEYKEKEQFYEWLLIPEETFILEPDEQIMFGIYGAETYVDGNFTGEEETYLEVTEQSEEAETGRQLTEIPFFYNKVTLRFPFQKEKKVKILNFFPNVGAVFPGGTENIQWNITGAEKGFLRNERTGETKELEGIGKRVVQEKITETTEFTLEAEDENGNKDSRKILIRTSPPLLEKWRLNRQEETVEWDVQCIETLYWKGEVKKDVDKENRLGRNRGSRSLADIGKTDRLTIYSQDTKRDFESTLWIPNQYEQTEILQFRKTVTYFYGYQLLEVLWELKEETAMTLICHDLERNQFFTVAVNQSNGRWEQVVPRIPGEKKDYLKIRLQVKGEEAEREVIF